MSDKRIRILLIDDHHVVRAGLAAILNGQSDLRVVGEGDDGKQAINLYEKLRPDIVLMDARMPDMSGVEATSAILAKFPKARIIMLTTYDTSEDVYQALNAGVRGYLVKTMFAAEIVKAIRAVHDGQRFIPPQLGSRAAERFQYSNLTNREVQIIQLLEKGLSNKEIADALHFTENTAKAHLRNIMGKLGVEDRTQVVVLALKRGIIKLE